MFNTNDKIMNWNNTVKFTISLILFLMCGNVLAQDSEQPEINEGIATIRNDYQIFPVAKKGNSIYINKKRLLTRPNLVLKDIVEVFEGHVVYGLSEDGQPELEYIGLPSVKFKKIAKGYYQITNEKRKKKLIRVNPADQIQILLPRSNTASGLVFNGENKAAFFHIFRGSTVESDDGKQNYQYTFKIHIIRSTDDDITTLNETVSDFNPRLKLKWLKANLLEYQLSNGVIKNLRIN